MTARGSTSTVTATQVLPAVKPGVRGPVENVVVDSCSEDLATPINWNSRDLLYINNDCVQEQLFRLACGYAEADSGRLPDWRRG